MLNKKRYSIFINGNWNYFEPFNNPNIKKTLSLNDGYVQYEEQIKTSITFSGDIYAQLLSILLDNYCQCTLIPILIECYCNGSWNEHIRGYLDTKKRTIDFNHCTITSEIIGQTLNGCLTEKMDDTYNFYGLETINTELNLNQIGLSRCYKYIRSDGTIQQDLCDENFTGDAGGWCVLKETFLAYAIDGTQIFEVIYIRIGRVGILPNLPPDNDLEWILIDPINNFWVACPPPFLLSYLQTINVDLNLVTNQLEIDINYALYQDGKLLNDLLREMFQPCFDCVISDFFNLNSDQLGDHIQTIYYQLAVANYHHITVHAASNVIHPTYSNLATAPAYEMNYANLINMLSNTFNVHLGIVDGCLRIEHQVYWDNLRYNNVIDINNLKSDYKYKKVLSYNSQQNTKTISKSWSNDIKTNYFEWPDYNHNSSCNDPAVVLNDKTSTVDNRGIDAFETNIVGAYENEEYSTDISEFFLVSNILETNGNYYVKEFNLPLSGSFLQQLFNYNNELLSNFELARITISNYNGCTFDPLVAIQTDLPINNGKAFIKEVVTDCNCIIELVLYFPCAT